MTYSSQTVAGFRPGLLFQKGFTLIEILTVLIIVGFFIGISSRLFSGHDAQQRFDETRCRLQEIRQALLGSRGAYVNGQRQFGGYIADMGELPVLNRNGQPGALWRRGSLPAWGFRNRSKIWMGWKGPYLDVPPNYISDSVLKDGWGNPFKFIKGPYASNNMEEGGLKVMSTGADGKAGGSGYARDIEIIIRETEYIGAVAGHVNPVDGEFNNVRVEIFYPAFGKEESCVIEKVDQDGYFRFEKGAKGAGEESVNIPQGVRRLAVSISGMEKKEVIFCVEPTGNWLGSMRF